MQKKKSLTISEKAVYLINFLVFISLLISYVLPFITPEKAPKIALLSLLLPVLYILNILFFIFWLLKGKKQLILSLIALLAGYQYLSALYKGKGKEFIMEKDVKVMSYNVKMLNHYQWSEDDSLAYKTAYFIEQKKPNILLLQEFYNNKNIAFDYPHKYVKMKSKRNKFGLAIFSEYPILNSGSLDFKDSANNTIFCDLQIQQDTVRVYNVHLESLKVNPEAENFGQENSEKLLDRLANTFKKQAQQVTTFKRHSDEWKGKTIVGGDFNNTAFSWAYREIRGERKDAFVEAGTGTGKSFDYFFPLRIDFILVDDSIDVNLFTTHDVNYSDHFPISANLALD